MNVRRIVLPICFLACVFFAKAQSIDTISFVWEGIASTKWLSVYVTPNQNFTINWGNGSVTTHSVSSGLWADWYFAFPNYATIPGNYTVTVIGSPTCTLWGVECASIINDNATYIDVSKAKNLYDVSWKNSNIRNIHGDYNHRFVNNGSIACEYNQLRLTKIDTIKPLTFAPHNPNALPQYLELRTITCDTIDFSSEAAITSKATGLTGNTLFQVFKMDSSFVVTKPNYNDYRIIWTGIISGRNRAYLLPTNQGDYTETGGVFRFYTPGE
ncbi:MAG: hypothetical protein LBI45_00005, partial [Bacteroidales bacterium]|nr:hypothetical protein [Bacteroidales bacterium]